MLKPQNVPMNISARFTDYVSNIGGVSVALGVYIFDPYARESDVATVVMAYGLICVSTCILLGCIYAGWFLLRFPVLFSREEKHHYWADVIGYSLIGAVVLFVLVSQYSIAGGVSDMTVLLLSLVYVSGKLRKLRHHLVRKLGNADVGQERSSH